MKQAVSEKYPNLKELFKELEIVKKEHITVGEKFLNSDEREIYIRTLYIIGTLKRSMELVDGVLILTNQWNATSAIPLLRLQLDSLIRLAYLIGQKDAENICTEVLLHNKSFHQLKGKDGKRLTDARLIEYCSPYYPWIQSVYKETSQLIHFSYKHILGTMSDTGKERNARIAIATGVQNWPEKEIEIFLKAVIFSTRTLLSIVNDVSEYNIKYHKDKKKV